MGSALELLSPRGSELLGHHPSSPSRILQQTLWASSRHRLSQNSHRQKAAGIFQGEQRKAGSWKGFPQTQAGL